MCSRIDMQTHSTPHHGASPLQRLKLIKI